MRLEYQARGLSFVARQPLSSVLAGARASRLRGRGLDFDELRLYNPGDERLCGWASLSCAPLPRSGIARRCCWWISA